MHRYFLLFFLLIAGSLGWAEAGFAQSTDGLPARPSPFRFVTDEARLLTEANVKTLENGLRSYADETGTQIVVVTVPSLGGRSVSDYGRALGESWGIGQRTKNNGIVLLLSGQERKVTIQAGSGLQSVITPELTARVINQQMTPSFKEGNYFGGLRKGLNTLMLAANPSSDPRKDQAATASGATTLPDAGPAAGSPELGSTPPAQAYDPATEPFKPQSSVPAPESSGLGLGTLAIGALLIGGVIWLLVRVFRRRNPTPATPNTGNTPDFMGNRPAGSTNNGPVNRSGPQQSAPDFYGNGNRMGGNMGSTNNSGGGIGMGGVLATGAAAAAGAYLGNRMASGGHDENNYNNGQNAAGLGGQSSSSDANAAGLAGGAGLAGAAGGSSDFPALGNTNDTGPDYFSDAASSSEPDYFSSDDSSSYDDLSSDDTGGGGFDSGDDNSGSW